MKVDATVVITTKNRKEEVVEAVRSVLAQQAEVDVLVVDDGSTDGTADAIRSEFPSVRVERSEQSLGLIVQRNRAASMVSTPIIISIDDDAILPSPGILAQTIADFDDARIGAVAMPYIDVKFDTRVHQKAPGQDGIYVLHTYRGTAHAVRRDTFHRLGGYRGFLFHQGEEGEYCLRMLNAGYIVRAGRAAPLHHLASPRRDWSRIHMYTARNNVLSAWYNVPIPYLPFHLAGTTANVLLFALRQGQISIMTKGLLLGYQAIFHELRQRQPVSSSSYRLFRRIMKSPSVPEMGDILRELPRPAFSGA